MSKEEFRVPGNRRSGSLDSRENILDILEKDDVVRRLMSLALVFDDQGHPRHAKATYEKVMKERERETLKEKEKDQVILFCQGKISFISRQCGLYTRAGEQCWQVLSLSLRLTGPNSSLSLQTVGDLALAWRDQGEFDIAFNIIHDILDMSNCSLYQNALQIRLVNILAIILRDCGHYDLSLFLTQNALRASDALFGNDHPFTLDVALELSQTLTEVGTHDLAEEFARRASYGFAKMFGTDHPQSLKAASRLADAMRFQKGLGGATELFERTLKAQKLQLGSAHPDTVPTKCGLAATYALEARFRDSASILRQTLDQQSADGQIPLANAVWMREALQKVHEFQETLRKDLVSENKIEEESHRMMDFFESPFRKDQTNLKQFPVISLSKELTCEIRSQGYLRRLASTSDASIDLKHTFPSSLDKASVSGLWGSALHAACFKGDIESVQTLLNSEVDIHAEGGIFETPLRAAIYGSHMNIVDLLLEHDANIKDYGDLGLSALRLALSKGNSDLARTLVYNGLNLEVTDDWYGTILHEASMTGEEKIVDLLLEAKAEPNATTGIFGTALGAAAWKGNLTIVQSLIKKGANVDIQVEGRTPLDLAISERHHDIMEVLIGAADNGNEVPKWREISEPVNEKSVEPVKPVSESLKPGEQPAPWKQRSLKHTEPQKQRLTDQPSPDPSNKSMQDVMKVKGRSRQRQAGKKRTKRISIADDIKSAFKNRIPAPLRHTALSLRKRAHSSSVR